MNYDDLKQRYGSPAQIAKALNVSRQLVAYWRKQGRIPEARQAYIQVKTKGRLKADERKERA